MSGSAVARGENSIEVDMLHLRERRERRGEEILVSLTGAEGALVGESEEGERVMEKGGRKEKTKKKEFRNGLCCLRRLCPSGCL